MELFGMAGSRITNRCNKMHQLFHFVALLSGGQFQLLDGLCYRKINFATTF